LLDKPELHGLDGAKNTRVYSNQLRMATPEPQLRLAEIEVNKSPLDEKIIGVFRYESESRGKRGPVLVVLAEISSTLYVYEQLLDVVNASAEQIRHLVSAVDTDPMARFEKLIQRLNDAIADFLSREPSQVAWNRVNMFVLEISGEHICISGLGRLSNILLQKQSDGSYRSFDLFGSLEQPADIQPEKPFAALICGELHAGDILFAGTSNFERLRHELQIAQRLKTLPPVTAALEIQQDIERQEIPDDFAALVMANVALPSPEALTREKISEPAKEKSTASIERMYQEEQTAQAMLGPTIAPLPSPAPAQAWQTHLRQQILTWRSAFRSPRSALRSWLSRRTPLRDPVTMASLRGMSAGHGSFITQKHKRTAALIAGAIVLFGGGTLWYHLAQRSSAEQAAWDAAYRQAMDKRTQAETEMIYGNEDHSVRLIAEAEQIATSLDEKTSTRRTNRAKLESALADVRTKLRHEMRVEQPPELLGLPARNGNPLHAVAWSQGHLTAFDPSVNSLFIVDPNTHAQKRLAWPPTIAAPHTASPMKDGVLFAVDPHTALHLDAQTGQLVSLPFEGRRATSTEVGVAYSRRFYVLDPLEGMIWKYTLGATIGSESAYLKQTNASLAKADAMTIDTSVYVGFSDGQLVRYLSGVQESWAPAAIDPPLTSITSLWTTTEIDRLVVADPVGKRVIVFRKDGKLIAQITSPAFQEPRSVTGDDVHKKIYVSDGSRVFSFDLP